MIATGCAIYGWECAIVIATPEFDVLSWFQLDAPDMIAARERGRLINRMLNIRSSGDEVEETVRSILARRLEHNAYVTHGHVVDAALTISP